MSDFKFIFLFLSIFIIVISHIGDTETTQSTTTNGGFNESDTFLYVEPCIYFYTSSIVATVYTKNTSSAYTSTEYTLPGTLTTDSDSTCSTNSSYNYLSWTYNNTNDNSNPFSVFQLGLNVTQYTGTAWTWWNISTLSGTVKLNQNWNSKPNQGWGTSTFSFTLEAYELDEEIPLQAPVNRSYHCTDGVMLAYYGPSSSLSAYPWGNTSYPPPMLLNFTSLQMEFFRQSSFAKSFSMSLDCESLFTTGMLMAIFAVAILLAIVFFGITMLLSIQTIDRFDDTRDEKYKAQMALMQQLHMKAD